MKSGIYKIKNLINGKIYIGSSVNIDNRIRQHFNELKRGNHKSEHLQNAYLNDREYFIYGVIEYCDKENLLKQEQYWLDLYKSYNHNIGYNIQITAGSPKGIKHSEEYKKKMSEKLKTIIITKEHREKIKISIDNSLKVFPNKRNKDKWPCEKGKRCNCKDCMKRLVKFRKQRKIDKYFNNIPPVIWN